MKELLSTIAALELKRLEYKLSQAKWAKLLGMKPQNYSSFLAGRRDLPKTAMETAYEFGVHPDYLFQRRPYKGASDIAKALKSQECAA